MTSAPRAWLALIRELFSPHPEYRAITRRETKGGLMPSRHRARAHRGRSSTR